MAASEVRPAREEEVRVSEPGPLSDIDTIREALDWYDDGDNCSPYKPALAALDRLAAERALAEYTERSAPE